MDTTEHPCTRVTRVEAAGEQFPRLDSGGWGSNILLIWKVKKGDRMGWEVDVMGKVIGTGFKEGSGIVPVQGQHNQGKESGMRKGPEGKD